MSSDSVKFDERYTESLLLTKELTEEILPNLETLKSNWIINTAEGSAMVHLGKIRYCVE